MTVIIDSIALIAAQRAAMSPEARAEADVVQARLREVLDEMFAKPPEQRAQPTWREETTARRELDGRLTMIRMWVRTQPDERTARAQEQRRAKHRRRRKKDQRIPKLRDRRHTYTPLSRRPDSYEVRYCTPALTQDKVHRRPYATRAEAEHHRDDITTHDGVTDCHIVTIEDISCT